MYKMYFIPCMLIYPLFVVQLYRLLGLVTLSINPLNFMHGKLNFMLHDLVAKANYSSGSLFSTFNYSQGLILLINCWY